MGDGSNAKITEQDLVVLSQEHIFWLDIAMNQSLVMCVLQRACNLLDIGDDER